MQLCVENNKNIWEISDMCQDISWKDELNSNNIFVERDQKTRYTIK